MKFVMVEQLGQVTFYLFKTVILLRLLLGEGLPSPCGFDRGVVVLGEGVLLAGGGVLAGGVASFELAGEGLGGL